MNIVTINEVENILQTYSIEDIFNMNELTEADVLYFLVEQEFVTLPNPKPL